MRIVEYPTPTLKEPSAPITVDEFGTVALMKEVSKMRLALWNKPNAVGIAAPQIGLNKRIIIVRTDDIDRVMFNPTLSGLSESMFKSAEGCLSVPKVKGNVQRHWSVVANYQDEYGEKHSEVLVGFASAVAQHEVGHLEGVLFTDLLTGSDKRKADAKLNKLRRKYGGNKSNR